MSIANVALSNTFNEFRTTSNEVITRINEFEDGTGVINATSATFSGSVNASSLSISSNVEVTENIVATGNVTGLYLIGDGTFLTNAGATITDDTTSSSDFYVLFDNATSGSATSVGVSSTKLIYVPSTGNLTATIITTDTISGNTTFSSNGQIVVPVGTTDERTANTAGAFRFNLDLSQFEGYNGTAWGAIGGGGGAAVGGGDDEIFFESEQTANNTYTITANKNALTTGPLTIASGATVTVPSGTRFVII